MHIPQYTYLPTLDGRLDCFWILTVMITRAVTILEHGTFRRWLRLRALSCMRTSQTFSKVALILHSCQQSEHSFGVTSL